MRTFLFLPPLPRGSGGLAVLEELGHALLRAGFAVQAVRRQGEPASALPCLDWSEADPGPGDVWLVPEGWPNALAPGLKAGARCVVWCQNHGMLFASLPEGLTWDRLPVQFLAVSRPVAFFLEQALGVRPPVLQPGIDPALFHAPSPPLARPAPAGEPVRIAWMPRKNKALGMQIQRLLDHMIARRTDMPALRDGPVVWEQIHGLDRPGVAAALRRCHLFLATGFPEGCPLPPLEAMASGCLVAGFPGFGGWDYLRQAWELPPELSPAGRMGPWFPLPEDDPYAAGNALLAPDGDVLAAALALAEGVRWRRATDPRLARVLDTTLAAGQALAASRSLDHFAARAAALWQRAAANEAFA